MSTVMLRCERTGREESLAAGLAVALSDVDVMATAPGGYAAVPATDRDTEFVNGLAEREGIAFIACPADRAPDTYRLAEVSRRLAAVRLGVIRRSLDLAVEHLSGRESGGEPLVRKQMITATIADVMAEVEMLRAYATSQSDPAALAELHTRLDEVGWEVTTLFGAAGYIADHPARALYVSAIVASVWIDREGVTP
ncbi:MAG TPA: acyl-CoA dehydrogenase family protein [Actinokineospora sp.]|nr:acyl-CoA dehydrogenase family protein [Actinokineospora sp.]